MVQEPATYLGYGSNLWRHQMTVRCPTSECLGVACLNGYRWIINERGYANVVQTSDRPEKEPDSKIPFTNVSYGLVYRLQTEDETRLDGNEGVPVAYTKEYLPCNFWPARKDGKPVDLTEKPKQINMLVYINRKQIRVDKPKKEYIYRMNMGIKDAVKEGVPQAYVDKVMREFIPEKHDEEVEAQAEKQALVFEDEK